MPPIPFRTGTTLPDQLSVGRGNRRQQCRVVPGGPEANLDPSMANYAMMALLDSDPTAKGYFEAALHRLGQPAPTADDTPSELWPFAGRHHPWRRPAAHREAAGHQRRDQRPEHHCQSVGARGRPHRSRRCGPAHPWVCRGIFRPRRSRTRQGAFVAPTLQAAEAAAGRRHAGLHFRSDHQQSGHVQRQHQRRRRLQQLPDGGELPGRAAQRAASRQGHRAGPVRPLRARHRRVRRTSRRFGSAPATSAMQAAGLKVAAELGRRVGGARRRRPIGCGGTTTSTASRHGHRRGRQRRRRRESATARRTGDSGLVGCSVAGAWPSPVRRHLGTWSGVGAVDAGGAARSCRRRLRRREVGHDHHPAAAGRCLANSRPAATTPIPAARPPNPSALARACAPPMSAPGSVRTRCSSGSR